MVVSGGCVGWGQFEWCERLTFHLGILRLINRGQDRSRRVGFSRRQTKARAWAHPWSLSRGGKTARL